MNDEKKYWNDYKYLNYDMNSDYKWPKNMQDLMDEIEKVFYDNDRACLEYDNLCEVLCATAKQYKLMGIISDTEFRYLTEKYNL